MQKSQVLHEKLFAKIKTLINLKAFNAIYFSDFAPISKIIFQ